MSINFNAISLKQISQERREYELFKNIWSFNKRMCIGGLEVDLNQELPTFYREHQEDKTFRCKITPFINFSKKIIAALPKMVFAQDVQRSGDYVNFFMDWANSVDFDGTTLKQFVFDIILLQKSIGKMAVLVDSQDAGKPYCVSYFPENIIRWNWVGSTLDWVVIRETEFVNDSIENAPYEKEIFRYYGRDEICAWETTKKNELKIMEGFPKVNVLKMVPIVFFNSFSKKHGLSIQDYSSWEMNKLNLAIINILSCLLLNTSSLNGILVLPDDEIERAGANLDATASQILAKYGEGELRKRSAEKLSINQALIEDINTKGITRIVSPANTIDQILLVMSTLIGMMKDYSGIANLQENNESGIAKSYRFEEMKSNLNNLADYAEQKERQIIKIALKIMNPFKEYDIEKINVEYERNYSVKDFVDIFDEITKAEQSLLMTVPAFATGYYTDKALQIRPELQPEELETIKSEISKMVAQMGILSQLKKREA